MSKTISQIHPLAMRRKALGWSQDELAAQSGIPRSSVSAIEASRLTPSVTAALAVSKALQCSVEELFGSGIEDAKQRTDWAWQPRSSAGRYWEAEVGGQRWLYPVESLPGSALAHDGISRAGVLHERSEWDAAQTLVLAGCDPAAGLLAAEYAAASGFRLLAFSRGGGTALELLKQGVVHVAALHRSTKNEPERNAQTVHERLGKGYRLLRSAEWQEGVVLPSDDSTRSVSACSKNVRQWAMREPGSAARECLDALLDKPRPSKRVMLQPSRRRRSRARRLGRCRRMRATLRGGRRPAIPTCAQRIARSLFPCCNGTRSTRASPDPPAPQPRASSLDRRTTRLRCATHGRASGSLTQRR